MPHRLVIPYKVVVLGKGVLAARVASWFLLAPDYHLTCVVPNMPTSDWTINLDKWGEGARIPVIRPGLARDAEPQHIDLAVSVTYAKILRPDFIARCRKCINIHNGPLPRYRGVNPINWALKNGETEHGVTVHDITPGIDDGPILATCRFPINPEVDEVIDVYERSLHFGWKLFKEFIPHVWTHTGVAQDESEAQYYAAGQFSFLGERRYFTRAESAEKAV